MPNCPECGTKLGKAGSKWSGRKKVQKYQCSKCGRVVIATQEIKKT